MMMVLKLKRGVLSLQPLHVPPQQHPGQPACVVHWLRRLVGPWWCAPSPFLVAVRVCVWGGDGGESVELRWEKGRRERKDDDEGVCVAVSVAKMKASSNRHGGRKGDGHNDKGMMRMEEGVVVVCVFMAFLLFWCVCMCMWREGKKA